MTSAPGHDEDEGANRPGAPAASPTDGAPAPAAAPRAHGRRISAAIVALGVIGGLALAGAVVVLAGGGERGGTGSSEGAGNPLVATPVMPARPSAADTAAAAEAAGCTLRRMPDEGNTHTTGRVRYRSNPPTSGNHDPQWASDGNYAMEQTPPIGKLVHALEHGRVEIQYRQELAPARVVELALLFDRAPQYLLLFENRTGMPYDVAATAWTRLLGCRRMNDRTTAALDAFRRRFVLQAPERIVQAE